MSETTNYKLYVTDDRSEKFQDWQEKMNGTEDSNILKIDAILGEKADHSTPIDTYLRATEWTGVKAPFTQNISVDGLTADQNGLISISITASERQRNAARSASLSVIAQSAGKLKIAADGELPSVDIPVSIILLG